MKDNKPKIIALITSAIVIATLIVLAVIFWQPLYELVSDQARIEQLVESSGFWGPIVFILLQATQVIIAPIPGQVTGFVGGYLFGWALGTVYAMIGSAIGFIIVFWLSRKLGRPFIEYFFNKESIAKFDYLARSKGVFILFLIFLIPAFPDDLICYIAGLSSIPMRILVLISFLGRFPTTLLMCLAGAGLAQSNEKLLIIISLIMLLALGLAYWKRKDLEGWVRKRSIHASSKK